MMHVNFRSPTLSARRGRWITTALLAPLLVLTACAAHQPGQSRQLRDAVRIAAGSTHTCAVTSGGYVKCWGANKHGQLGDGTRTGKRSPVDVSGLMTAVKDVTVGERHSCAVTATNNLKCWGSNHDYQLGDGTRQDRVTPVEVADIHGDVRAAAAGEQHTCVLTAAGGVKCWGKNQDGQLGDGSALDKSKPVDVAGLSTGVTAVVAGANHTCALMTSGGGVRCWGNNQDGQLGDGTTVSRNTPIEVAGLGAGITALAAGSQHTCALIDNGTVRCWGQNQRGQLGDGTTTDRVAPVSVADLTSGVTILVAGGQHSCALLLNGTMKCWGNNGSGQLGSGSVLLKTTPIIVTVTATPAVAMTAGRTHTCALLSDNNVRCWGDNEQGQLGEDPKGPQAHS